MSFLSIILSIFYQIKSWILYSFWWFFLKKKRHHSEAWHFEVRKMRKTRHSYITYKDVYFCQIFNIYIVWNKEKTTSKNVEKNGKLSELKKIYDEHIAHFKAEAKRLTLENVSVESFISQIGYTFILLYTFEKKLKLYSLFLLVIFV